MGDNKLMKIENLKNGQVLKNYKELCEVLGIEPTKKANNQRLAQFKELDRYCKYHKEGHKIIIDQIYSKELEKVDKRTLGNNNNQARCIRYLLLNLLSCYKIEQDEVIGFSKGLLLRKLYMTNENYITAKTSRKQYAEALEVNEMAVNECFDYIENNSISAIRKAIATLRSQSILGYKYSFSWVDHTGKVHHCTTIEENIIHLMEEEAMEEMNIRNKNKIWEFGRWDEFKKKVTFKLIENYKELFPKIDYYFYSFHFNYNNESIQRQMRYMEQRQGMNYEVAKVGVQDLWSESLDKTIDNRHNKAKMVWGDHIEPIKNYRKHSNYKPEQTKVKNSIVKQDHPKVEISEQITMDLNQIEVQF